MKLTFTLCHVVASLLILAILLPLVGHTQYEWQKTDAAAYRGKQDDIHFINPDRGWYVNGSGKIYKTVNGGKDWQLIFDKPGTFFRCVGFIDSLRGFAGNIGIEYFPNVTDTVPLYKTLDGGKTWQPVAYKGPTVKGLCAIDILKVPYINHGVLAYKHQVTAGGRVGSPAFLLRSFDDGVTFQSEDLNARCAYILDIKFLDEDDGFIIAGTNKTVAKSNALILRTTNGGKTWKNVYQSKRPYEITWKASFPTKKTGYVTIQNYNPDSSFITRYVAKTTNGGKTWKELKMVDDFGVREFGIGFINEKIGWVGTTKNGFETIDGGKTWTKRNIGNAVNKIRILNKPGGGYIGYAIGTNVFKLEVN